MVAILSDIHGNRPALEAVVAEMDKLSVKRMLELGDVVGYGPFPNDCLRMISGAEVCLQGNHEAGGAEHGAEHGVRPLLVRC